MWKPPLVTKWTIKSDISESPNIHLKSLSSKLHITDVFSVLEKAAQMETAECKLKTCICLILQLGKDSIPAMLSKQGAFFATWVEAEAASSTYETFNRSWWSNEDGEFLPPLPLSEEMGTFPRIIQKNVRHSLLKPTVLKYIWKNWVVWCSFSIGSLYFPSLGAGLCQGPMSSSLNSSVENELVCWPVFSSGEGREVGKGGSVCTRAFFVSNALKVNRALSPFSYISRQWQQAWLNAAVGIVPAQYGRCGIRPLTGFLPCREWGAAGFWCCLYPHHDVAGPRLCTLQVLSFSQCFLCDGDFKVSSIWTCHPKSFC